VSRGKDLENGMRGEDGERARTTGKKEEATQGVLKESRREALKKIKELVKKKEDQFGGRKGSRAAR